jgi:hypothetical protein
MQALKSRKDWRKRVIEEITRSYFPSKRDYPIAQKQNNHTEESEVGDRRGQPKLL